MFKNNTEGCMKIMQVECHFEVKRGANGKMTKPFNLHSFLSERKFAP